MSVPGLLRLATAALAFTASAALAGGPLGICNNAPLRYAAPSSVTLNYDRGTLGARSKAQADAIVNAAIAMWTNVPTATVTLAHGTDLPVDVTAANYTTYYSNFSDGLNPVIYDTDGSIIDTLLGTGQKNSVLGFAGSAWFPAPTCRYAEGRAVINGFISVSDATMTNVIAHELGHLIGLDHTQLDSTQGLASSNYPLMYPIAFRTLQSLGEDDASAVTALYPDTNVAAGYGTLNGSFRLADGATPIRGANIWVKENTSGKVYSNVSDYLMQNNGAFQVLLPPGTYTLHAEAISTQFTGGSSVGPYSDLSTDPSFQAPLYVAGVPMAALTLGNASPVNFAITAGCVATASFRFDGTGAVTGNCGGPSVTVTPSAGPNGTITPNVPQTVSQGTSVTFTVTPATGYSAAVGGTCGGTLTGNTYTTNPVTANCTVAASFAPTTYTVTPSAGPNGTITPNVPQTVSPLTSVTFTVTPAANYSAVVGGTCGGTLTGTTYTTSPVTASCTVAASFTPIAYTVTPSAGPNGTITPSVPQTASPLTSVTFTVTPAAGYSAVVGGTCGGLLTGTTYITSPVTADCTVLASFTPITSARLANISTRARVLTGEDVMIGGFIIGGGAPKTVIVRARGPSLAQNVPGVLANPVLQLFSGQTQIAVNDNWGDAANASQIQSSGFAPPDALESAILVTLNPGAYTAIMSGVGATTGVGLIEVFELDHPEVPLVNIATRARVLTGSDVMIGGFIIQGNGPQTVVVRARGPSMGTQGVANPLANPVLQLFSGQTQIAVNDNWGDAANASQIQSSGFAPPDALESAIMVTLNPGAYTAIVTGAGGTTGVGLIEVFAR